MDLENIVEKLHALNFGKDGLIEFGEDYCFKRFQDSGGKHNPKGITVCPICEKYLECEKKKDENKDLKFTRITHGTHALDFLDAHGVDRDTVAAWSQKPILFVMENPGAVDTRKNGGDLPIEENGSRCISERWYWVMGQCEKPNEKFFYPNFFVQKEYGWMIYSVIRTFQMANAYVTNMVKCGMVSEEEKGKKNYLTTDEYPPKVADLCIAERLKMELDCLRGGNNDEKVIVFAFGERTYYRLKEDLKDENISLCLLPHPANRLANDYRKYVLFGKVLRALLQNQFYNGVEKPNFEAILAADKDIEPEESREDFCKVSLEQIIKALKENGEDAEGRLGKDATPQKRKSYAKDENDKSICYEFVYLKDPQGVVSDELEKFVLRQRLIPSIIYTQKGKDRKYTFHVSWVEYNFRTKEIRLFAGRGKSESNILIENDDMQAKNFLILRIIEAFAKKYQAKYESPND